MSEVASAAPKTNGFAVAALVNGIVGIAFFWTVVLGVCSILAVVFGHISLNQLKVTQQDGRGMAVAGLTLGYVAIGLWSLAIIAAAVVAISS